jgi:hypothetical protein
MPLFVVPSRSSKKKLYFKTINFAAHLRNEHGMLREGSKTQGKQQNSNQVFHDSRRLVANKVKDCLSDFSLSFPDS